MWLRRPFSHHAMYVRSIASVHHAMYIRKHRISASFRPRSMHTSPGISKPHLTHSMRLPMRSLQRMIILEVLLRLLECRRHRSRQRRATPHTELNGLPASPSVQLHESSTNPTHATPVMTGYKSETYCLCSSIRLASMVSSVWSASLKSAISASQRDLVKSSRTTTRMSFIWSECGAMV